MNIDHKTIESSGKALGALIVAIFIAYGVYSSVQSNKEMMKRHEQAAKEFKVEQEKFDKEFENFNKNF